MGYIIYSDTLLNAQAISEALLKNEDLPLAYLRRSSTSRPFYMHCMRRDPYKYLVLDVTEVDQLIQMSLEYDLSMEELCNVLAHREENEEIDNQRNQRTTALQINALPALQSVQVHGIEAALLADPGFRAWLAHAQASPATSGEYHVRVIHEAAPARAHRAAVHSWILHNMETVNVGGTEDDAAGSSNAGTAGVSHANTASGNDVDAAGENKVGAAGENKAGAAGVNEANAVDRKEAGGNKGVQGNNEPQDVIMAESKAIDGHVAEGIGKCEVVGQKEAAKMDTAN